MSMVGYFRGQSNLNSGYRSSAFDCFCFYDTHSAFTAHAAAQRLATRVGGKVVAYWGPLCGYDLKSMFSSVETVGQDIGEWDGEAVMEVAS